MLVKLTFNTKDAPTIWVRKEAVDAIVPGGYENTGALVHIGGQKFDVKETVAEVKKLVE